MAMITMAFVGVSIYKNPEVLDTEKQILEIDQKLELFDAHPEKIQSEFERKPRRNKDSRSKTKNKSDQKNPTKSERGNLDQKAKAQNKATDSSNKSESQNKKSKHRRRHRNKSGKLPRGQ